MINITNRVAVSICKKRNYLLFFGLVTPAIISATLWIKTDHDIKNAIRLQVKCIKQVATHIAAGGSSISDGDVTAFFIGLGAFNINSQVDARSRAAMSRLKIDTVSKTVTNEFGGELRIIAKNNDVTVFYTQVPDDVCPTEAICQ